MYQSSLVGNSGAGFVTLTYGEQFLQEMDETVLHSCEPALNEMDQFPRGRNLLVNNGATCLQG